MFTASLDTTIITIYVMIDYIMISKKSVFKLKKKVSYYYRIITKTSIQKQVKKYNNTTIF